MLFSQERRELSLPSVWLARIRAIFGSIGRRVFLGKSSFSSISTGSRAIDKLASTLRTWKGALTAGESLLKEFRISHTTAIT
jgi:hypothetical protein